ncbi:hypothetical protein ACFSTE_22750 [Aquimarina hainanensis]|uniref:Anti-sigma factor n=1 Tax=Aquimarina hainanensis TaxID=1578017 RepID=A0ABW5NEX8_9FLAO|nr:hypothetical protein [Aquimarina sp. TRL1]QKX03387.1 hypothetical protein HN014_00075 [Aquimarina sp. TRL1]
MMDDFEKYISQNRDKFDTYHTNHDTMWNAISSELDASASKKRSWYQYPVLKIAASIIIIAGVFSIISLMINNPTGTSDQSMANQELLDIDQYYQRLVSNQVARIQNNPKLLPSDKEEFLIFMDELDKEYDLLKIEMRKNLNNERILEAIVKNYKKRIELIENLLNQINTAKKLKNDEEGYIL